MRHPVITRLVEALGAIGEEVEVDLTDGHPALVARTGGLVFAVAWPGDEGIFLRLRLDAGHVEDAHLSPAPPGALAYESLLRTPADVDQVIDLLMESLETATRIRAAGRTMS
jgi:hypothetical protein